MRLHHGLPFLIVFLCSALTGLAQNLHLIDSIKTQLKSSAGSKQFDLLNDLAWEYRASYPDSTIYFAKQAQTLAKKLNLKKGLAKSINFIGVAQNHKGERLLAFQSYAEALRIAVEQHDSVQHAYSTINLGRLFFEQGLLSRAYEYYTKALPVFETLKDSSGLCYTYQSLANLFKIQHDYVKAESHYLKALEMRLALHNTRDIMAALVMTGRLYQTKKDEDKAIEFLLRADSAGRVIHDEINLAEIKTNLATSYLNKGLLNKAEIMCAEGLNAILKKNNVLILPQAYLTMGQIKFKMKDLASAKKYFDAALKVAIRTRDMTSKMDSYYWLWRLSETGNNKTAVLENYNKYLILKDSIKDLDLTRQVERIQFEIEIERKERENELLKANSSINEATIHQQRLQNIILIIIILFATALGLFQWRNLRARKKVNSKLAKQNNFIELQRNEISTQNEKLSQRNQELFDLNKEKDTLMSFVAHDLKSPMHRIKGVSSLLEMEASLTETQRMYIQIIKDATQAELDIIKDVLDAHMLEENIIPTYSNVSVDLALRKRIESLHQVAQLKSIQLHADLTQIENETLNIDESYLNRIVDNLISNAIKFSSRSSTVLIVAGKTTNNNIWISVKDQGPGFSDHDKQHLFQKFRKLSAQPTAGESSNGLGLAIVKTLVDRLNGSIELRSSLGKGSEFIVTFPIQ
ncbi:MAG TPA: tetratricopeptide repeat-containing sensor histidine kinase [Cyclobacteriaceae bacterium]|nr:tetratricopeptide repeat-containing sensor histidine kinase [Cyclobacteriaceae bacterium]